CGIYVTRGTSQKILKVIVDEVCKWNDTTTSVIRLVHDPFINSKVGPARSLGVSVSTLSRFIIKLEKSKGLARSCSNHDPELEVSSAEKTIQDAEKIEQWFDHLHLFQTPDIKVCPSKIVCTGSSAKADSLADTCRDLDPVVDMPALLVAISNGALADSGSLPSLCLLDPRSDPAEGPSS
nr:hypothetical protein [Tanacetum cinerariifolium]